MAPCSYCGEKEAVTSCDVCGSAVCGDCKLEYGCRVCDGGERKLK
ncbi:MAG: orotate phosphoribosyltransferase [Candidatus Nanohalobium sp.]